MLEKGLETLSVFYQDGVTGFQLGLEQLVLQF